MAKRWYIVHAYTNFERKVADAIRERAKAAGLQVVSDIEKPVPELPEIRRYVDHNSFVFKPRMAVAI